MITDTTQSPDSLGSLSSSPSEGDKTPDVICMARLEVLDLLEELGAAATHLNEAYGDFESGNTRGSEMCVEDAIEIMARIERMSADIGASLTKWVDYEANTQSQAPAAATPNTVITEPTQPPESLGSPSGSPAGIPYAFPKTQGYGDFRLPWRHDTFIHPAWGHEVHRVLSFDDCECYHGSGRDCIQIVNASRGTDADREVSPEWARLSAHVKKNFI